MRLLSITPDLFFSVRIKSALERAGHQIRTVEHLDELDDALAEMNPALAILDIGAAGAWPWAEIIPALRAADEALPILCFGSHTDVDAIRRAKALGAARVVARSEFVNKMPEFVERYGRKE